MPKNGQIDLPKTVYTRGEEEESKERKHHSYRQDKGAVKNAREASAKPSSSVTVMRAGTNAEQSAQRFRSKTRAVKITLWVKSPFKREIERIAQEEGLSISRTGAALIERALQNHVDMQYSAILVPVVEQAVRREIQKTTDRLAALLVRVAFDAGQTRSISTNILRRQPGVSDEVLSIILEEAHKTARANISRKSPHLKDLIEQIRTSLQADPDEEERVNQEKTRGFENRYMT